MKLRNVEKFILLALPLGVVTCLLSAVVGIVIFAPGFYKLAAIPVLLPCGLWSLALRAGLEEWGEK